jgi:hypothetical protein
VRIGTEKQKRSSRSSGQVSNLPADRSFTHEDWLKTVQEDTFKNQLIAELKNFGWHVHHCRPAVSQSGKWATPIQGHKGFPDIVAVRERIIWAELKKVGSYLSAEQKVWRDALIGTGAEYYLWRPSDWDEIGRVIR